MCCSKLYFKIIFGEKKLNRPSLGAHGVRVPRDVVGDDGEAVRSTTVESGGDEQTNEPLAML